MTDLDHARTIHRAPGFTMPAGATDCHMHVFGPFDRFPLAAARTYVPPVATVDDYRALQRQTGLQRVVFVQPSVYGTDNRCMLDAMAAIGPASRGIAVVEPDAPRAALEALNAAGVRGIRLNIASTAGERDAAATLARIRQAASQVAPLGWHVQIFASASLVAALGDALRGLPAPLVLDHMGKPDAAAGLGQAGFAALLRLLDDGHVWVKLSGPYRVADDATMARATPFAAALARAAPDRVVWGSDWPHAGNHPHHPGASASIGFRDLDSGDLLDLLHAAMPDPAALRRVLVDNPARLYGF